MTKRRRSSTKGTDNWLITYSDMVTLLLAFFVMMFSFSTIDVDKFQRLLMSVYSALGIDLKVDMGGAPLPPLEENLDELVVDAEQLLLKRDRQQLEEVRAQLERGLAHNFPGLRFELRMEQRGLVVRFADSVLFDSGKAELKPAAQEILLKIGEELAGLPNHVRIEGHTDDRPIHTTQFPSNWELSTARATEVIQFLMKNTNFPPTRLSAAG